MTVKLASMINNEGSVDSVYIVHGLAAAPCNHWFQSLKTALEQKNVEVHIPAMPESSTPDLQKWLAHLKNEVTAQKRAFFVGHSLGCITLLHFLSHVYTGEISGLCLVAPFDEKLPNRPVMDSFTTANPDYAGLKRRCAASYVFASTNDLAVPLRMSESVSKKLGASFVVVENAGHFLASEGYTSFRLLENTCRNMIRDANSQKTAGKIQ